MAEKQRTAVSHWAGFLPPGAIIMTRKTAVGNSECQACKLVLTGDPHSRLALIGEAGKGQSPFTGSSGELLDKMIAAIGLARKDLCLVEIFRCGRGTGSCATAVSDELGKLRAEVLVALGDSACRTLLGTAHQISESRGRFHPFRSARVMPTHEPAYLLSNASAKREAWGDLQQVARELGLQIAGAKK